MSYLIRKKGLLFFVTLLLIASGYFVYFHKDGSPAPTYQKEEVASVSSVKQMEEKDSDNDGLKDWEEALWQTDINNPDTDGDGTKDGDEIKENRNPLIAGPDDKIIIKNTESNTANSGEKIATLTDAVGQTFIGEITMSKNADGEVTRAEINELAESVFGALKNYSEEIDKYNLENFQILANSTEEEVKIYANELAKIIKKEFDPIPESEMDIFNIALSQEDNEKLQELGSLSSAYKNVSIESLKLKVPDQLKNEHLVIVNSFEQIAENLKKMKETLTDPALGFLGLQNYTKNIQTAFKALNNINDYLANNQIVFNEEEPANLFALYTDLKTDQ